MANNSLDAACTARASEIQNGVSDSSVDFQNALSGMTLQDIHDTMNRGACADLVADGTLPSFGFMDETETPEQAASNLVQTADQYLDAANAGTPEAAVFAVAAVGQMEDNRERGTDFFSQTMRTVEDMTPDRLSYTDNHEPIDEVLGRVSGVQYELGATIGASFYSAGEENLSVTASSPYDNSAQASLQRYGAPDWTKIRLDHESGSIQFSPVHNW